MSHVPTRPQFLFSAIQLLHNAYLGIGHLPLHQVFSAEFKQHLPEAALSEFLASVHQQYGRPKTVTGFRGTASEAHLVVELEAGTLNVDIFTDGVQQVNALAITPVASTPVGGEVKTSDMLLHLPFEGQWFVVWGGDTREENYHVESRAQKHAFDFVMVDENGSHHAGNGTCNEDFYCFSQTILSPCEATVVLVVDGVNDNPPGTTNAAFVTGNTIVLKTASNEFIWLAHLKQYSIQVKPGEIIAAHTPLALCGNSGNSYEPHLHFHMQDGEDLTNSTGIKCFFTSISVNGNEKDRYSPVKADCVVNAG